jgi:thiamine biosynthesis lipoprotein
MKLPVAAGVYRFTHHAMSTVFETMISGVDEVYAGQASRAAFNEIDRIERLFSRYDPTSEISRINRLISGQSMRIGLETYECLEAAESIRRATGGAFDINVKSIAKYLRSHGGGPGYGEAFKMLPRIKLAARFGWFEARIAKGRKGIPIEGVDLDLGGVGKGYALERAMAVLNEWSIEDALIHGGTSSAIASGSAPGEDKKGGGWPVGVGGGLCPPGVPDSISLRHRALSGSGTEVKGAHIIDPRSGCPARGHIAAWVMHPSATEADALSTAFMVMSTSEVERYCRRQQDVWALVVAGRSECLVFSS